MFRDNLLRPFYREAHFHTVSYPITCLDLLQSSVTLKMDAAGYSKRMANMYQSIITPKPKFRYHKGIFTTAGNVLLQFKPQYE
jgi:hypothetical protein